LTGGKLRNLIVVNPNENASELTRAAEVVVAMARESARLRFGRNMSDYDTDRIAITIVADAQAILDQKLVEHESTSPHFNEVIDAILGSN
jgi:cell division GTPase FtsZ